MDYNIDKEYKKTWRKLSLIAIYGSLDKRHQTLYNNHKQSNFIFKNLISIRESYEI